MTRDEAIAAYRGVNAGYGAYEKSEAEKFIDRLEALGLLKLDDCKDACHPTHKTRISDASSFDEICVVCGATDVAGGGWGQLAIPVHRRPQDRGEAK